MGDFRPLQDPWRPPHRAVNPFRLARRFEAAVAEGLSYREVGERFGVTAAQVCGYLAVLRRAAAVIGSGPPVAPSCLPAARPPKEAWRQRTQTP